MPIVVTNPITTPPRSKHAGGHSGGTASGTHASHAATPNVPHRQSSGASSRRSGSSGVGHRSTRVGAHAAAVARSALNALGSVYAVHPSVTVLPMVAMAPGSAPSTTGSTQDGLLASLLGGQHTALQQLGAGQPVHLGGAPAPHAARGHLKSTHARASRHVARPATAHPRVAHARAARTPRLPAPPIQLPATPFEGHDSRAPTGATLATIPPVTRRRPH